MLLEGYKKWIIIVIFLAIFGLVIFALTRSHYKTEKPEDRELKKAPATGPVLEHSEIMRVVPLEQLGVDTKNPESLALLGDEYYENSRFGQAIAIYEKVLELNPEDVDTYNDMGLALYYTGKSDAAIETLKKGTDVMPSYQRIWLSLGFVLTSTGKKEEAETALKKAMELNPDTDVGQEAKRMLGLLK